MCKVGHHNYEMRYVIHNPFDLGGLRRPSCSIERKVCKNCGHKVRARLDLDGYAKGGKIVKWVPYPDREKTFKTLEQAVFYDFDIFDVTDIPSIPGFGSDIDYDRAMEICADYVKYRGPNQYYLAVGDLKEEFDVQTEEALQIMKICCEISDELV